MERPVGVSVIAVLYFIAGACLALLGVVLIVGAGAFSTFARQSGMMPLVMAGGAVAAVVLWILGGLMILIGWGLWSQRNWARIVAIVLSALGVVSAVPGVFLLGGLHMGHLLWGGAFIRIAVHVVIVWYLLQNDVGRTFRTT